ncbi:MAG: hypothetical protein GY780_12485 [bacterium]|nr:hypothetical protein [bacterium]
MISPVIASIIPKTQPTAKDSQAQKPGHPARPPRPGAEDLASSIMQDGGLGFLTSRLEDKLNSLFEKASEANPELAAAGPGAFFNSSTDVSPEATADRIVGFALGLKSVFARQNEDLDEKEMMARFESEIRRGIGEGFSDARGILGGLEMLDGEIEEGVDATWDLVQQRLDDYFGGLGEDEAD